MTDETSPAAEPTALMRLSLAQLSALLLAGTGARFTRLAGTTAEGLLVLEVAGAGVPDLAGEVVPVTVDPPRRVRLERLPGRARP